MKAKITIKTVKALKPKDKPFELVDTELKGFLLRIQPTGRMTFYYSYRTYTGIRKRIKIGVLGSNLSIQQARDHATQFAAQVVTGEDIQESKQKIKIAANEKNERTLETFIENHYKPWAQANIKSAERTIHHIYRNFPELKQSPMEQISVNQIEKWRTLKLKEGSKPATVNRYVSSLSGVLTKAVEWEAIEDHPLRKLKQLKLDNSPKVRFLSESEEDALFSVLSLRDQEIKDSRNRGNQHRAERGYELMENLSELTFADRMTPLIILSLKTGMRRGELFDLEWQNISFDRKTITVIAETAKSNKTRHIPLSPTALKAIKDWKKQITNKFGRVFPSDNGERLDNVRKSWATILKDAKIASFRWHDMRHDFASKLVMKGVPLNTVRELCGHSDLNTTLRYAHLAPDHKADAVALIG